MNILHITTHMGDGVGKAVGGLARLGSESGRDTHRILLLDEPIKFNHIDRCREAGIEILIKNEAESAISVADIIVLSWWGSSVMDDFLAAFPPIPCRVMLWAHKNCYFDPPLPDMLFNECDHLLATTPSTLENLEWKEKATLVYGLGDFMPDSVCQKRDYSLKDDRFVIGYIGTPSYKRFPHNAIEYLQTAISMIPRAEFVLVGEYSDEFKRDVIEAGLSDKVKITGWVNDVYSLLRSFDVLGYLMRPDISASTENSVLEAMAAALPVVVSRYPIGKYLLDDGISGFLAENPDEYGRIMHRLYSDEDLRRSIGEEARQYAGNKYSARDNQKRFDEACMSTMEQEKKIRIFERKPKT